MNNVLVTGRLTRDLVPSSKETFVWLNGSIAVDRDFKNKNGEKECDFLNFKAYDREHSKLATIISQFAHKGDKILLEGSLRVDRYTDKNGNEQSMTYILVDRVEFLAQKVNSPYNQEQPQNNAYFNQEYQNPINYTQSTQNAKNTPEMSVKNDFDNDLPF